ncbi:MAG: urate oxidase [Phycisphaeraceae bacterium]|nr:urate oxidase [Phycisphaeraceae bacterium]
MAVVLGQNNYGKSRVRMVKVVRDGAQHTVKEISVDIALEGDFGAIHTSGDNANCLPTDTMKNTVYALGKSHPLDSIEGFALHVARHFVEKTAPVSAASVRVSQVPWERVAVDGKEHPHTFTKGSEERQTCEVRSDKQGASMAIGGIKGLLILKSADSAFSGYLKDSYTTLPETRDRIMATSVTATWKYGLPKAEFAGCRGLIRGALVKAFAGHKSESVQQTLYAMGEAALNECDAIESIRLSLPNIHCLLVNLKPFGIENANEIFVPTDEPFGLIEATITRS